MDQTLSFPLNPQISFERPEISGVYPFAKSFPPNLSKTPRECSSLTNFPPFTPRKTNPLPSWRHSMVSAHVVGLQSFGAKWSILTLASKPQKKHKKPENGDSIYFTLGGKNIKYLVFEKPTRNGRLCAHPVTSFIQFAKENTAKVCGRGRAKTFNPILLSQSYSDTKNAPIPSLNLNRYNWRQPPRRPHHMYKQTAP